MTLAAVTPTVTAPPAGDGGPAVPPSAAPATPAAPAAPAKGTPPAEPSRVAGSDFDADAAMAEALKVVTGKGETQTETKETPKPQEAKTEEKPKGDEEELPPPPADLTQKKLSEGFAKLERQKRRDQKAFTETQAKLAAKEQELAAKEQAWAQREASFKQHQENPLVLLEQHGWNFDRLVKFVMDDGKVPPEVLAERASAAQKKQIEDQQKRLDAIEAQRRANEDVVLSQEWERRTFAGVEAVLGTEAAPKEHTHQMIRWVEENSGRQAVLADVLAVQAAHFQKTRQTLDPATALVHVEQAYARMFSRRAGNPAQVGAGAPANPGAEKPRQLTSQDRSDVSMPSQAEIDNMSNDERMALAIRISQGSPR